MTPRTLTKIAALLAGAALLIGTVPASAATEANGPELPSFALALLYSLGNPEADPPGANDWACRPAVRHPRPVVLVHGTWENRYS